jgi:hypothetical protein
MDNDNKDESFSIEKVTRLDYSSLQISLYFFLLIFFVLLNSINKAPSPEQSKKAVLSISKTFNKNDQNEDYDNEIILFQNNQLINSIKNFYLKTIKFIVPTTFEIVKEEDSSIIELRISNIGFFRKATSKEIKTLQRFFLADLAKIMNKNISGYNLKLTISLGVKDLLLTSNQDNINLALDQLAEIERYLVANKVESNLIILNLRQDEPNELRFNFNLQD